MSITPSLLHGVHSAAHLTTHRHLTRNFSRQERHLHCRKTICECLRDTRGLRARCRRFAFPLRCLPFTSPTDDEVVTELWIRHDASENSTGLGLRRCYLRSECLSADSFLWRVARLR